MARFLDMTLIAVLAAILVAMVVYKLFLLYHYRNDPAKREALISTGQVAPKRLTKWIYDKHPDSNSLQSSPSNRKK